jgi:hypothetical protein
LTALAIRSVSLHLKDRIIDHPNSMIRDTYQIFYHAPDARFERDLPAGLFVLGGVKGFHAQRLETAKGLIDLFSARAEGAGFMTRPNFASIRNDLRIDALDSKPGKSRVVWKAREGSQLAWRRSWRQNYLTR